MSRLTPQQVWHERLQRALDRENFSRAVRDWAHDLLVLRAHQSEFMRFSDDGQPPKRWPNTAAGDHDATERATMELMDRIGVHVGIGAFPRSPGVDDADTTERQRLRELHRALVADARADVDLALKVGTLVAVGYKRSEVARMLGVDARDMVLPLERLERVALTLDRDDEL